MFKGTSSHSIVILLFCSFFSLIVIITNTVTIIKGNETRQKWNEYSNQALQASLQLNDLERYFGYGGFIHHFKNLILRKEQVYFEMAEEDILLTNSSIEALKKSEILKNMGAELDHISTTFDAYKTKFYDLKEGRIELGLPTENLDRLVKVDDSRALYALGKIINQIDNEREQKKSELDFAQQDLMFSIRYLAYSVIAALLSFLGLSLMFIRIRDSRKQLESLFQYSPNGILMVSSKGVIIRANIQMLTMFLYQEEELIGKSIDVLIPTVSKKKHHRLLSEYIAKPNNFHAMKSSRPLVGIRKDGIEVPIEVSLSTFQTSTNETVAVANVSDVSEKQQLKIKSEYDHLTRLLNKQAFEDRFSKILQKPSSEPLSVFLIDIDLFKQVNDTYGHLVGDETLIRFSNALYRVARKNDILFRWGGEEFVVLAPQLAQENLLDACERFRHAIEAVEFKYVGSLTCSIGATICKQGDSIESVLKRADEALYTAKSTGRNRCVLNPRED